MKGYGDFRWNEECFDHCSGSCSSCLHSSTNINKATTSIPSKKFVTLGSVRYGVRLGAVSPPPPGAGPQYRSQCCWPSVSNTDLVSRTPLLASPAINTSDIYKPVERMRMLKENTSELLDPATIIRNQVVCSTKLLLKNQLKRRAVVRPQASYARLCDCGNSERVDILNTLDRLPRFRFGGNRNSNSRKERDLDKKSKELRLRELTDRLRKHSPSSTPHNEVICENLETSLVNSIKDAPEFISRSTPLRSASFSQVDYSSGDRKYIRRKKPGEQTPQTEQHSNRKTFTSETNLENQTQEEPSELLTFLQTNIRFENVNGETNSETNACDNILVNDNNTDEQPELRNVQERKRDKSRRRKGMYISQWPNSPHESENNLPVQCELPLNEHVSTTELPKLKIGIENSDSELCAPNTPENLSPEYKDVTLCVPGSVDAEKKVKSLLRSNSLIERTARGKSDQPSDASDSEAQSSLSRESLEHNQKRYWKRPLRGPYGQILEAEMNKPELGRKILYNNDLKFLETIPGACSTGLSSSNSVGSGDPRPKCLNRVRGHSNHSLDDSDLKSLERCVNFQNKKIDASQSSLAEPLQNLVVIHQRTTSSPSKLGFTTPSPSEATNELLEELLSGSSEQLATTENLQRNNDTRTHVVIELYETERSYVESLEILVSKYLEPLKSSENVGLIDGVLVDEIFYQIPSLLSYHKEFLNELKMRLEHWDVKQKVGDLFLETLSKPEVIESYTNYVNNCKRARDIIKTAQQSKPALAKFLENTAREHKGKLALDSLLIKPIQKFPKYELLLQRLIKHTDIDHPDHNLLIAAQREVHDQLIKINCIEREALELEQLREMEGLIEGLMELAAADRQYLRNDSVCMAAGGGTRKDRAIFLFSDLLLVTSIKRKSGTTRKPTAGQATVTNLLEANKFKLLLRLSLDSLEIVKAKDENLKQVMLEIENLSEDIALLNQINDITWNLHCNHTSLDELIKEMYEKLNKQLIEQQNSDSQLACLDLQFTNSGNPDNLTIMFSKPEVRASWEEAFNEAKLKLATSGERRPPLDLIATVPIRKTRAGLQFTCAAPVIGDNRREVWVCNSDGYVGQICVLGLHPDPNVASCNGVCSSRILCITLVPGISSLQSQNGKDLIDSEVKEEQSSIQFDSSSSSEDEHSDVDEPIDFTNIHSLPKTAETTSIDSEEGDNLQSTIWLGTEDGCIHVYNSNDNIRTKKNKLKIQHGSTILSIVYLDNKVYSSLGNGDIIIYERESTGNWNTQSSTTISIGTTAMPVTKIVPNVKKLWFGCGNAVKIFNTETLLTENNLTVNTDVNKPVNCIILFGNALWVSVQNSAIVKCFHTLSFELLCEVNVAPAVTKMLTSCDDIIRQHKAACLRVTALLACKDLLWIGTSAGVLLTMTLPHITPTTTKINNIPSVVGVTHGHTGHVRFLTNVEYQVTSTDHSRNSCKGKPEPRNTVKLLVISGGDGYEDFRSSNISEVAGREDSTNHLLLWNV